MQGNEKALDKRQEEQVDKQESGEQVEGRKGTRGKKQGTVDKRESKR